MIEINKVFEDVNEMHEFIKKYLRDYAPAGYMTDVEIETFQTYEMWEQNELHYKVKITRLESCD